MPSSRPTSAHHPSRNDTGHYDFTKQLVNALVDCIRAGSKDNNAANCIIRAAMLHAIIDWSSDADLVTKSRRFRKLVRAMPGVYLDLENDVSRWRDTRSRAEKSATKTPTRTPEKPKAVQLPDGDRDHSRPPAQDDASDKRPIARKGKKGARRSL